MSGVAFRPAVFAALTAMALVAAALVGAAARAAAQDAGDPAADEIVIDLDFDATFYFGAFEELVFESRCAGIDEPQLLTLALEDFPPWGAASFVLVKHAELTTCDVELLKVPPNWALREPQQNPAVGIAAGTVTEWRLAAVPDGMGLLRMEIQAQVDSIAFILGGGEPLPAFVSYGCGDGHVVHTRAWPGFAFPALGDILNTISAGTEIPNTGTLVKTVAVPVGRCAVWSTTRPGSGVYLSGGSTVDIRSAEFTRLTLVGRNAPGDDFLCQGLPATIVGTEGDDVMRGTTGSDVIYADAGDDRVYGGGGADIICGGAGNDQLWGNAGKDHLLGGLGNDIVRGGRGRDVLAGGAGNDVADGGIHVNTCEAEFVRRCEAG